MPPVDGTYAPQSPDLSSFLSSSSSSSTPANPQLQPSTSSYTPRSPRLPDFSSPEQSAQGFQASSSGYQVPQSAQQYQGFGDRDYQRRHSSYLPPIPDLPPSHNFDLIQGQQGRQAQSQYTSPSYQAPTNYSQLRSPQEVYSRNPYSLPQQALTYQSPVPIPFQQAFPHQQSYAPPHLTAESTHAGMSTRVKRERPVKGGISQDVPAHLGVSQGIEVRTKFPVARIKRIMQADEEVGKVAQVTPVAVSKALELFMISLVTKSATLARSASSKRVTAVHLKKAIEADEQFDFLNEIVAKVAEGPDAGQGKRAKEEEEGSESDEKPKKKGRRKKGE